MFNNHECSMIIFALMIKLIIFAAIVGKFSHKYLSLCMCLFINKCILDLVISHKNPKLSGKGIKFAIVIIFYSIFLKLIWQNSMILASIFIHLCSWWICATPSLVYPKMADVVPTN